jgi:hypothetical protein
MGVAALYLDQSPIQSDPASYKWEENLKANANLAAFHSQIQRMMSSSTNVTAKVPD